jgi:hypothetical protein
MERGSYKNKPHGSIGVSHDPELYRNTRGLFIIQLGCGHMAYYHAIKSEPRAEEQGPARERSATWLNIRPSKGGRAQDLGA